MRKVLGPPPYLLNWVTVEMIQEVKDLMAITVVKGPTRRLRSEPSDMMAARVSESLLGTTDGDTVVRPPGLPRRPWIALTLARVLLFSISPSIVLE